MKTMKWQNKNKKIVFLAIFLLISFSLANFFVIPILPANAEDEVNTLNGKIGDKKKEIDALQKEIEAFKQNIKEKQSEAKTLSNQIAILENQIAKIDLDIKATQARIEQTNLEIQSLNLQITESEKQISDQKEKISEYLRLINKQDQISYLEMILINDNFSDYFDEMKYTQEIHSNLSKMLLKFKKSKQDLEIQKSNWEEKAQLEEKLKDELQKQREDIEEKNNVHSELLIQTKLTEKQYKANLSQLQAEQYQINSEITSLEKTIRKKLEERQKQEQYEKFGPAKLGWPVSPGRGITAYFHDADYPFRYIFEHPAIDIRASQGTSIKSAEAGYVAKVKFNGSKAYGYVMVVHADGLSTVYGHVSAVYVKEDEYVAKGQVIAASGGMPGTPGAGNMTTGPHLHFEVRLNGIPVNPLEYLPPL